MANHVNKVVVNGVVRLDLTSDTVDPDSLIEGVQAHDNSGAVILGTLSVRSIDDLQISRIHYNTARSVSKRCSNR